HRGGLQLLFEQIANLAVLGEQLAEFLLPGIPFRAPVLVDADAQTDWIGFLTHTDYSSDKRILMWQRRLRMGPADPRALGVKRRIVVAVPATASLTHNFSVCSSLYSGLCSLRSSALAMAEFRVLATNRADLRGTIFNTACACRAGNPWICRTISRIFCADIGTFFMIACTCIFRKCSDGVVE